ncbi:MAG: hypothetical protein A3H01_00915 [Candidatus Wildermuthbacteria bacterium RIFCSPLOWO2_12_FULL_40_9]|uniref:Uncharacterized protein n=2 Tax=Candidatus Wildermuthiibacteriota TaxID=1817923 RepID=A0A1G2RDM0_9BACT|nr:MAG: hypothetical protein A3F15_02135 [Candidatus Wildermuthbacteria bacterium RIFCSPHIGHO2_12_FULL_40_12]OHA76821.1 MAG: hypothetical protein A3H01_00915 [Candidatus Wildermuthbacteria bacterium RIFCSPLOWO2_12_FULL_40_9]
MEIFVKWFLSVVTIALIFKLCGIQFNIIFAILTAYSLVFLVLNIAKIWLKAQSPARDYDFTDKDQ